VRGGDGAAGFLGHGERDGLYLRSKLTEWYDTGEVAVSKPVIFGMCLALLEGWALAQNPPASSPSKVPDKEMCTVSGRVVAAATNLPLRKASVHMRYAEESGPGRGYGAQTDDSGRFSISGILPGRYSLYVERVGYVRQSYGEGAAHDTEAVLTLAPGGKMQELIFRMVAWSVISGRITNEDGEPVVGAQVMAFESVVEHGKRVLGVSQPARTNDLGEFRLWGLSKGRYYIRAEKPHEERVPRLRKPVHGGTTTATGYAPIYYPGTPEVAHAVAVEVRAGQQIPSMNFILIPSPAARVSGRVTNTLSVRPLEWTQVVLLRVEDGSVQDFDPPATTAAGKGMFQFDDVLPGTYELVAQAPMDGHSYTARRRITVGNSDVEDADITISRGVEVRGRVTVQGGGGPNLASMAIGLQVPGQQFSEPEWGKVRPDGSFEIPGVSAGTYEVECETRGRGTYVKSIRMEGRDVLANGLAVPTAGIVGPVEIVLSAAGAVVEGTVTDGNGLAVAGATAVLVPEGELRSVYRLYRSGNTDQFGKFIIRDVRPGEYKVFSWTEVQPGDWEDAEFLKPVEGKGVKIALEENAHKTVDVKVIPSPAEERTTP